MSRRPRTYEMAGSTGRPSRHSPQPLNPIAADNNMIQERDIEQLAYLVQARGHIPVGLRRFQCSCRVVMSEKDPGGTYRQRSLDDLAGIDDALVDRTLGDHFGADHLVGRVEEQRCYVLISPGAKGEPQILFDITPIAENRALGKALTKAVGCQFPHQSEEQRCAWTDTYNVRQLRDFRVEYAAHRVEMREKPPCNRLGILPWLHECEQQLDNLVFVEGGDAASAESLSKPCPMSLVGVVYHSTDIAAAVIPAPTEQNTSLSCGCMPFSISISANGILALDVLPM